MDKMNAYGGWELEEKAKAVLEQVGIADPFMAVEEMSGGQRRKVTVAAAMLGSPDVLILDEPTNHMDIQVPSPSRLCVSPHYLEAFKRFVNFADM